MLPPQLEVCILEISKAPRAYPLAAPATTSSDPSTIPVAPNEPRPAGFSRRLSAPIISWKLFDRLHTLTATEWPCEGLALIPKAVTRLRIERLRGDLTQTYLDKGSLFELFSPNIAHLALLRRLDDDGAQLQPKAPILPQRMGHLPVLKTLNLDFFGLFDVKLLRELPKDIESVTIKLTKSTLEDAAFIPPSATCLSLSKYFGSTADGIGHYWPLWTPPPPNFGQSNRNIFKARHAEFHAATPS